MKRTKPWDEWIPGVLSQKQIVQIVDDGHVDGALTSAADYSSLDLHLGSAGYSMPTGSIKPFGEPYLASLINSKLLKPMAPSGNGAFILYARRTYLFSIRERVGHLRGSAIFGQATAKSSIGRMDVLARLIVDGMDEYEGFDPSKISSGDLFVEITPMTFNVVVRPGIPVTQLRLFKGKPDECRVDGEHIYKTVLTGDGDSPATGSLSVDLSPVIIASPRPNGKSVSASAFCSRLHTRNDSPLLLWKLKQENKRPKPWKYWNLATADDAQRLRISKNRFYIIRSYEKIALPAGVAVYCRASDESIGEMRIHYAGFVHPYFGWKRDDGADGTPLIFEVRGHDVDVNLRHREKMARLEFYRMSQDCEKVEKKSKKKDKYEKQTLQLSGFFADWPKRGSVDDQGTFTPFIRR